MAQDKKPPRKTSARKKVKKKATKKVKGKPVPDSPQQKKPDNILTAPSSARPPRTKSGAHIERWTEILQEAGRARTINAPPRADQSEAAEAPDADRSEGGAEEANGEAEPEKLIGVIADTLDDDASIVIERASDWSSLQRGYESRVLTPTVLLVAMLESYRSASNNWGRTASVWSLAAERILAEQRRYEEWRASVMNAGFYPGMTIMGRGARAAASKIEREEGFDELLKTASRLCSSGFWTDEFGLDHLFAAMMTRSDLISRSILEQLDVATEDGVAAIVSGIAQSTDKKLWSAFFEEALEKTGPGKPHPTVPIAARFAADTPDADDLLDVEGEAKAFARYVAKQELDTPLAIGLFGDWGSGKSFFMHRMQRFVSELAGNGAPWCDHIVQVEFNAWHYIEGNLWASLVEHMLGALETWSKDENKEDQIEALFRQFESARQVERDSSEKLESAKRARNDAEGELDEARAALEERIKKRGQLNARTLWTLIDRTFAGKLANDNALASKLRDAGVTLGLPGLEKSARDLGGVIRQAGATRSRVRLLLGSLVSRKRSAVQWAIIVATVALAPFAVGAAWTWLSVNSGWPARIGAGIAELSALVSVVVAWAGRGLATASSALGELEGASTLLESVVKEETATRDKELAEAEASVATASERVAKAEARLSGARAAVDEAKRALEAETPRSRLTRFLKKRLDNGDYARHLGVVSMIRKDFELLSSIMTNRDWSAENRRRLVEAGVDAANLRTFDRIVLYIDDLDRCPAEKVVEVLQAVHLLLAFPLFVVVVGVDARWVSRSLIQHYPYLLNENVVGDVAEGNDDVPPTSRDAELIASSHDYLEKIFQVPYWVKPMDAESSVKFLEGLARQSNNMQADGKKAEDEATVGSGDVGELRPAGDAEIEESVADRDAPADNLPAGPPAAVTPAENVDQEFDDDTGDSEQEAPADITVPMLAELPLTEFEIKFMSTLAPSVGRSPRRSKRFFNVYQLIRAGLAAGERERFVGGRGQGVDYRIVMILLAIVTGSPILAPRFFRVLVGEAGAVKKLADLQKYCGDDKAFAESGEWLRFSTVLSVLNDVGNQQETLERLRYWTRRTMRFSFTAQPIAEGRAGDR
jgi:hypothetical protein